MIEIEWHRDYIGPWFIVYDTTQGLVDKKTECYSAGYARPNYPLPAIHYQVEFSPGIPAVLIDIHNGPWLMWAFAQGRWI